MDTTIEITATELKTNLGKYLDYVAENNEVVITKNGNKFVRLTPYITDIERYYAVKERSMDYQYGGKKVSYEEFMDIYEKSDLRMEFINGEIVLLASPNMVAGAQRGGVQQTQRVHAPQGADRLHENQAGVGQDRRADRKCEADRERGAGADAQGAGEQEHVGDDQQRDDDHERCDARTACEYER